jgi:hypothetical protein
MKTMWPARYASVPGGGSTNGNAIRYAPQRPRDPARKRAARQDIVRERATQKAAPAATKVAPPSIRIGVPSVSAVPGRCRRSVSSPA